MLFSYINLQIVKAAEPFQDDEINSYIGKEVTIEELHQLVILIETKYPKHSFLIKFKIVDAEIKWIKDAKGRTKIELKLKRVIIAEILDYGEKSSVQPQWQYHYEITLSPGYAAMHVRHYIQGLAIFDSLTYWNIINNSNDYAYIGIGLWNWNEWRGIHDIYNETPAWDISYTWSYPAYYSHSTWNLSWSTIHANVYYDWYYE
ncbi:MAG: hypothetical protein QXE38_02665 [Candidatus Methanomethylicia archaeon]